MPRKKAASSNGTAVIEAPATSVEDLKKRIGENLYDKRFSEYIDKLRREAFVKIYDPELAKTEKKS